MNANPTGCYIERSRIKPLTNFLFALESSLRTFSYLSACIFCFFTMLLNRVQDKEMFQTPPEKLEEELKYAENESPHNMQVTNLGGREILLSDFRGMYYIFVGNSTY